jgi:impB/mucB/samB family C-terminal domain/DNA polymerase-iota, thumb domain
MGVVKRWNEARGAAVIAECGTGKTLISLGAVQVHSERRPFTALAMVPPQLVEKWAREAFLTLPRVRVFFIDGLRTPTSSAGHAGVNEVRLRHGRILPVSRLPGVGKVTEEKLISLGIRTVTDLRQVDLSALDSRFGRYGVRLYELARGIDHSPVVPDRLTQSISSEDTFEKDVLLADLEPMIRKLAEKTWTAARKESRIPRTVVLKLKTSEFKILTRSHTPNTPPTSCEEFTSIALALRSRVELNPKQRFRLVGVGLSNFRGPEDATMQPALFD